MIVVIIGASGSGKTTAGRLLAQRLNWDFVDADDHHSAANRKKMQNGIPLTDADRLPWLQGLARIIRSHRDQGESMVLACSALRESYRRELGVDQKTVRTAYLKVDRQELIRRLAHRRHEFFEPSLLESQLNTFEEPRGGLIVDGNLPPETLAKQIADWISTL
jgi:gluconokinase